jgi:hypothetical protein
MLRGHKQFKVVGRNERVSLWRPWGRCLRRLIGAAAASGTGFAEAVGLPQRN